MTTSIADIAIVGGGIAGLAIAEIFARSGQDVVLLERNALLCQEASASQHGWFHFGSLYSIFPQNQFLRTMVGGVEDLREFYAGFPGMNIVAAQGGGLEFSALKDAWFRDEPIEYIVSARNNPDFDLTRFGSVRAYARKLAMLATWEIAIKQFISRHQRFMRHDWDGPVAASQWIPRAGFADYSRSVISKPNHPDIALDADTHFRIVGYDRPMRAQSIITDLARAVLGQGGQIHCNSDVEHIARDGAVQVLTLAGGRQIRARRVVVAAGKWLGQFLARERDAKVVVSPLLVAYPAVASHNLVRMTPFVEKSVNHLLHEVEGRTYSVIGGGYSAAPDDPAGIEHATRQLVAIARRTFPRLGEAEILRHYLGYKTEIVAKAGERNYQYFIRETQEGQWAVVPGKFSLAFSTAANTYRRITGRAPEGAVRLAPASEVAPYLGRTQHARIALGEDGVGTPLSLSSAM